MALDFIEHWKASA